MSVLMGIRMPKQNKNMRSVQVTLERLPATVIDAFKVCAVIRLSKFKTSLEPSPQFNTSAATTALEWRAMKEPLLCVKLERLPMKIMNSLLAKKKILSKATTGKRKVVRPGKINKPPKRNMPRTKIY